MFLLLGTAIVGIKALGGDDESDAASEQVDTSGSASMAAPTQENLQPLQVVVGPNTNETPNSNAQDAITIGPDGRPLPSNEFLKSAGDVITGLAPVEDTTPDASEEPTTAEPATPAAVPRQSAPGTDLAELYVDGKNGSDRNPGTKDKPFRRPIDAMRRANPGTTIYLRAGTYDTNTHGAFTMLRSGTPQNWIRIAAFPGETVELVDGGEFGSGLEVRGASYIEVANLVMKGRQDSIHGSGVFIKDGAHDIRIVGNRISGFGGAGISIVKATNILIEGNEVRDNAYRSHFQGSGITVFEPAGPLPANDAYSIVIRGNYVVRNYNKVPHHTRNEVTDGNCIIIDRSDLVGFKGKTLIENNVCVENGGRGIAFYKASNILVRNNTLVRDMWETGVLYFRGEITAVWGSNLTYANNLVINRSGVDPFIISRTDNPASLNNNYVASSPPSGDSNKVIPDGSLFSSTTVEGPASQYQPGSNLAGTANGDQQPSYDFFGKPRPSTGAVGAIEP